MLGFLARSRVANNNRDLGGADQVVLHCHLPRAQGIEWSEKHDQSRDRILWCKDDAAVE